MSCIKDLNLLKFRDYVSLQNLLFIHDFFNSKLPECFNGYFTLAREAHDHETRNADHGQIFIPSVEFERYGRKSFKIQSILQWNNIAEKFPFVDFTSIPRTKFTNMLVKHFIGDYSPNQSD